MQAHNSLVACPSCGHCFDPTPPPPAPPPERVERVQVTVRPPVELGAMPNEYEKQMMETVRAYVERLPQDKREDAILRSVPLLTGEDRSAWMGPDGKEAPWPERPRLFKLALLEAVQSGRKVRNVLRYKIIPEQLYPHAQSTQRLAAPAVPAASPGSAPEGRRWPTAEEVRQEQERKADEEAARVEAWKARVQARLSELEPGERERLRRQAASDLAKSGDSLRKMGLWERTVAWRYLLLVGERLGDALYRPR